MPLAGEVVRKSYLCPHAARGYRVKLQRQGYTARRTTDNIYIYIYIYTVKPPNRGHFGDGPFVPCREVVLFSEVLF